MKRKKAREIRFQIGMIDVKITVPARVVIDIETAEFSSLKIFESPKSIIFKGESSAFVKYRKFSGFKSL